MKFKTNSYDYFKFRFENESKTYVIPQDVKDGSDVIQFQSNWTKENLQGSTEPIVAFNYVDAPQVNINIQFHADMWNEAGFDLQPNIYPTYEETINALASLVYPGGTEYIEPPYCIISYGNYVYRGYFTNVRINQSGVIREVVTSDGATHSYKTLCELNSTFVIIKKTAPKRLALVKGFRTYFNE